LKNWQKIVFLSVILLVVVFLATPPILQLFYPLDSLPRPIRTQFDRIDTIGKGVQVSVARAKAFNKENFLTDVGREYEDVAIRFNQAVLLAKNGLALHSVDTTQLRPELEAIEESGTQVRDHLLPLSKPINKAGFDDDFAILWEMLQAALKNWQELLAERNARDGIVAEQLERMKWPDWQHIEASSSHF
jgi:hypothetical protein